MGTGDALLRFSLSVQVGDLRVREDRKVSAHDTGKAVDNIEQRIKDLNQERMRLPMRERRKRWKNYVSQLAHLTSAWASRPTPQIDARQTESPAE